MTRLTQGFNPNAYDPTQGGGGFPVGRHPVIIESAELTATKDETGGLLALTLKIIDGPAANTSGTYRLNLYNKSQRAAEIAHRQLSALCHVTQQFQLGADGTDVSVLFNIPFLIEVGMQKGDNAEGYTEVKKVFDINGNEPGKPPTNAPQQNNGGFANQQPQQQPQANGAGWGGGQQQAPQNAPQGNQQQQPAQAWGQPQQQAPQQGHQQPQGGGWGGGQPQQQPQQQAPAQQGWGNGNQAQGQPQGQPQQGGGNWQQGQNGGGQPAAWGQQG